MDRKNWNWEQRHPVIHISFPNIGVNIKDSLRDNLLSAYRGIYPTDSTEATGDLLLALKPCQASTCVSRFSRSYL